MPEVVASLSAGQLALYAVLAVVLVAVIVLARRLYQSRTYHYCCVDEGRLYRDGARKPAQVLKSCARAGIKTLVSLIGEDELKNARFSPIIGGVRGRGIECLHVPIGLGGWPQTAEINRFLQIATDEKNWPVLVHCREGLRRTGMMVAAYQMSILGMDRQAAKDAIQAFGHSSRLITDISRFIDLYDPQARTVIYTENVA